MKFLNRAASFLTQTLDWVIGSFFAAIILITIFQVILRYVFNSSIAGGNEALEVLFIYTTAIGAATAVKRRRHININYFVSLLPKSLQRFSDALVHLLVAGLNIMMIYYSAGWISKVGGNESPVMRVPEWTFQICIPIGCSLVIVYCLIIALLDILGNTPAKGGDPC